MQLAHFAPIAPVRTHRTSSTIRVRSSHSEQTVLSCKNPACKGKLR